MYKLDIAHVIIDRLWKPLLVTAAILVVTLICLGTLGLGVTASVLFWSAALGLLIWKFDAACLLLNKTLDKTVLLFRKHYTIVSDKVQVKWNSFYADVIGEVQAIADARKALSSAKTYRKDVRKELKASQKTVVKLSKALCKEIHENNIAQSKGTSGTLERLNSVADLQESVDAEVLHSQVLLQILSSFNQAIERLEDKYHNASRDYRTSKETASTS